LRGQIIVRHIWAIEFARDAVAVEGHGDRRFIDYPRSSFGTRGLGILAAARPVFPIAAPATWRETECGRPSNAFSMRKLPRSRAVRR
jgi:DNA primase